MAYPTATWDLIGLWTAWFLMLMIYTYPLYKENIAYRFAEHLYVGITLAISIITNFSNVMRLCVRPLIGGGHINDCAPYSRFSYLYNADSSI